MAERRVACVLCGIVLGLAACAPQEADYELSERARAAPNPLLAPTATFEAPLAGGTEAAARLAAETDALATRAAALRARGAALSDGAVIAPGGRARLTGAAVDAGEIDGGV